MWCAGWKKGRNKGGRALEVLKSCIRTITRLSPSTQTSNSQLPLSSPINIPAIARFKLFSPPNMSDSTEDQPGDVRSQSFHLHHPPSPHHTALRQSPHPKNQLGLSLSNRQSYCLPLVHLLIPSAALRPSLAISIRLLLHLSFSPLCRLPSFPVRPNIFRVSSHSPLTVCPVLGLYSVLVRTTRALCRNSGWQYTRGSGSPRPQMVH